MLVKNHPKPLNGLIEIKHEDTETQRIMTDKQLAAQWIQQMQEWGFSPDDMIRTIRLAREKYNELKRNENNDTTKNQS